MVLFKIEYKVLSDKDIAVDTSDEKVKAFWEAKQLEFMSEVSYEVQYIKQEKINKEHTATKISEHYAENKTHFKDEEGKILILEDAKSEVIAELDAKATKDKALRNYIAYKKAKLSSEVPIESIVISLESNPFGTETLEKIKSLSVTSPYLKPVKIEDEYFTFKLMKINQSQAKSYEDAKAIVLPMFVAEQKRTQLVSLAENSFKTFKGIQTDFITNKDAMKITAITLMEANDFLVQLFNTQSKQGYITLKDGKIVMYNILEQKLLTNINTTEDESIIRLKSAMFNEGIIKSLQNKYKTEIFMEGL